jgi:hypothetical protein
MEFGASVREEGRTDASGNKEKEEAPHFSLQ